MNDSAPTTIAVIQQRLPYIDRRSLSEAWFSALHLASDGPRPAAARDRRVALKTIAARPATQRTVVRAAPLAPGDRGISPAARRPVFASDASPGRAEKTRAAAAARTAFQRVRSYPPFRTSLTIGSEKHRVQLLMRRDGATLHVIALCTPRIADVVERALACADAHLRARGESIRSSVQTFATGPVGS